MDYLVLKVKQQGLTIKLEKEGMPLVPYSQHFSFSVTYEWDQ